MNSCAPESTVDAPRPARRILHAWFVVGVVLLVVGVRWGLLATFGSDVPYWDEWPAVAERLFKPALHGTVSWSALFALHNEHRIVLTRVWELVFFAINAHRWDPLLVQTANAVIAGATAGLLAACGVQRRTMLALALLLLVVPFGYSNLLISFQSQFLFFGLLSAVAITLWSGPAPTVLQLAGGVTCAALALFTVGSGVLTAVTLTGLGAIRAFWEPARRRQWLAASSAALVVVAAGASLSAAMPTLDIRATAAALGQNLAWPAGNFLPLVTDWPNSARYLPAATASWPSAETAWVPAIATFVQRHRWTEVVLYWAAGLLFHGPSFWLLLRTLRGRVSGWFTPALATWALLNIAAMAAARAETLVVPPRYQDILAMGLLASGLACYEIFSAAETLPRSPRRRRRVLAASWFAVVFISLAITAAGIFRVQMPRKRAENRAAAALLQQYLVSHDASLFVDQPPNHVPWPTREAALAELLRDPEIRRFLPRGVLPPTERPPAPWPSRAAAELRRYGWLVAALGTGLLVVGWRRQRPVTVARAP